MTAQVNKKPAHNASLGEPGGAPAATPVLQKLSELVIRWKERCERLRNAEREPNHRDGLISGIYDCKADVEKIISSHPNAVLPPPVSETEDLELLRQRAEAGDKFKAFVHSYLTQHGVPEGDPTSQHQIEGCRIGARLDLLLAKVSESPVGSTATGVEDEEIAREVMRDLSSLFGADLNKSEARKRVLAAIRKSKSLSEPKELEEEKQ